MDEHVQGDHTLGKGSEQNHELCHDVHIEDIVVAYADAIIDPGAVVVIAFNAAAADRAVPAATRTDRLTFRTKLRAVNLFEHGLEFDCLRFLEISRVLVDHRNEEDYVKNCDADIEVNCPVLHI